MNSLFAVVCPSWTIFVRASSERSKSLPVPQSARRPSTSPRDLCKISIYSIFIKHNSYTLVIYLQLRPPCIRCRLRQITKRQNQHRPVPASAARPGLRAAPSVVWQPEKYNTQSSRSTAIDDKRRKWKWHRKSSCEANDWVGSSHYFRVIWWILHFNLIPNGVAAGNPREWLCVTDQGHEFTATAHLFDKHTW